MTSKTYRTNRTYIFVIVIGLLLLVGLFLRFKGRIEEAGAGVREKIVKFKVQSLKFKTGELGKRSELERKVEVLENKIALLEQENQTLRKQLEAPLPPDLELLPAKVIGKSRFLFIDKGEKDKVKIGQSVISEDVFIGQVYKIGERSAKVLLLKDPESKIPVTTNRGAMGLLQENNGRLEISKILQKDELEEGDFVSTSGDKKIPSGILVGKISKVLEEGAQVYKSAVVEEAIDYKDLLYVFIVR
jgi:rod shape-determining protein MreC